MLAAIRDTDQRLATGRWWHEGSPLGPGAAPGVRYAAHSSGVSEPLAAALVRRLLGLPDQAIRTDIPARPDTWAEICGYYSPDPGPVTNLFLRATMGAGAEVSVRGGQLMLRPLHPVPVIRRGMRLHADDPDDPWVFRTEFPEYGFDLRVVFSHGQEAGRQVTRLLSDTFGFRKRPGARSPSRWVNGAVLTSASVAAIRRRRTKAALR